MIAARSASRESATFLSPVTATTFSKAGNCASTIFEARVLPPAVKTRWDSPWWKETVSSGPSSSMSRPSSVMALRGTRIRTGSLTLSAAARCAHARRWPSVATIETDSLSRTRSDPAR